MADDTSIDTVAARSDHDDAHFQAFDDVEEAFAWASAAAESAGSPFAVVYSPAGAEFRAGPVDDLDLVAAGDPAFALEAVYDEDGDLSPLEEDMFSDDEAVGASAAGGAHEAYLSRLSKAALAERAARRVRATEAGPLRIERGPAARRWRRDSAAVLSAYNERAATMTEALIKRRSVTTRQAAIRKKLNTTMDRNRHRVARNAKLWRLRNKSRAKRYGSLYHGPHTKVKEAAVDAGDRWVDAVVDADTGVVVRAASLDEVRAAIAGAGELVVERRRRADLAGA